MHAAPEPSLDVLGGQGWRASAQRAFLATRPQFLIAAVLPVMVGTVWGARSVGELDATATLIAMAVAALMAAAANVWNDVCDDACGTDRINDEHIYPFSGGSRFIQNGILSAGSMTRLAASLALLAFMLGVLLAWRHGWPVLGLGLSGAALGILYSWPPVQLAGRGVGELAIALAYGVLPVCGAAWLQSNAWEGPAFWLSVPVSAWIAAVLLINEVPDCKADAAVGKRTLPVRIGYRATAVTYGLLHTVALTGVAGWAFASGLSLSPVAGFAAVWLVAMTAAVRLARDPSHPGLAIRLTLAVHAAGCIGLMIWMLLTA